MLHLIPKPLHRILLRVAYSIQKKLRRATGRTRDGVTLIARDLEGQILLICHSYGPRDWFLPGGGMRAGETPERAAHRELAEETGCAIDGLKLVSELDETLSGAAHRNYLFEGVVNDMPRPDGREVIDARFFPTHSLPEPLNPRTRERLRIWREQRD